MYGSRALLIGWYLLAPKTEWTFYIFAVGLGLTWLATVPPTAAIVGKLFGIRYLADALRSHAALAPDRRIPRRVSRRHRARALRQLSVDVVRGHGAGRSRGDRQSADSRGSVTVGGDHNSFLPEPAIRLGSSGCGQHRFSRDDALLRGGLLKSMGWVYFEVSNDRRTTRRDRTRHRQLRMARQPAHVLVRRVPRSGADGLSARCG